MMPCHPARARILLREGRAKVVKKYPFTIVIVDREEFEAQEIQLKLDPGSNTTGIALVGKFQRGNEVLWAANLEHRGQKIKAALSARRTHRRSKRNRKTRYRPKRFNNRARSKGWLPPSLLSRVDNIMIWAKRLCKPAPVTSIEIETVRFDTQKMQNPEISGVEYQQGELCGYEMREYLLEKYNRTCVYCGAQNIPLEIEHLVSKAKGGSDRASNLAIACHSCNQRQQSLVSQS